MHDPFQARRATLGARAPAALVLKTIRLARGEGAAGGTAADLPPPVAELVRGGLQRMIAVKKKTALALLLTSVTQSVLTGGIQTTCLPTSKGLSTLPDSSCFSTSTGA